MSYENCTSHFAHWTSSPASLIIKSNIIKYSKKVFEISFELVLIKLIEILEFYEERNKSKIYSRKLHMEIQKSIRLLVKQPSLGIQTDEKLIRALIIGDYIIFYESTKNKLIIHSLWDCRQNPDDLIIK